MCVTIKALGASPRRSLVMGLGYGWFARLDGKLPERVCFLMVFQDSERCDNVSVELHSACPRSPALAAASHSSDTGWVSCGEDEFPLCALKLQNKTSKFQALLPSPFIP